MGVFLDSGAMGVRAFLSRPVLWRCSAGWAAFLLLGLRLVFVMGSLIQGGAVRAPLLADGVGPIAAAPFVMTFLGPIQEFGGRAVAQTRVQRRVAPIWAGALTGAIRGVWHLPGFFFRARYSVGAWSFLPFFIGNVVLAVPVSPLFNASPGSMLLPMLFHRQLINPFRPGARLSDMWILVAVSISVVWGHRDTLQRLRSLPLRLG